MREDTLGASESTRPSRAEETRARMRALNRAILSLSEDLSLEGVLHRIITAAQELANAQYAAIGVLDEHGQLARFIPVGLTEEEIQRMPHLPVGEGLIGEMVRSGESIRIPEIRDHPSSKGFPPGHPEMNTFLGVPISAYGRLLGQIYLTNRKDGLEFSVEDQQQIELLAGHSAAAIENARLHQQILENRSELALRNEELEVTNAISNAVSSDMELEELLGVMLSHVRNLFGAESGEIHLREEHQKVFSQAVHQSAAEAVFGEKVRFRLGEGWVGLVAESGRPLWTSKLATETEFMRKAVVEAGFGAIMSVPLKARGEVVGVVTLGFRGEREISAREVNLLEAIGAGVGINIENVRLARQARRLAVLEERDRIAMDLHDGIIQSIYAVGLTLESSVLSLDGQSRVLQGRLKEAIDGLNKVIRDIRTYILDLQPGRMRTENLREAIGQLAGEFRSNTGTALELLLEPEATSHLDNNMAEEIFHIAQEALANVAKHADASRVWLNIRQVDDEILIQVIDNGEGFDTEQEPKVLGHGLSNMIRRADALSGSFHITSSPGDGTTLTVRVPTDEKTPDPEKDLTLASTPEGLDSPSR